MLTIETQHAISQTGTILRTNKLFEITAWHYELFEKTKNWKKDFYTDKSEDVNTKNYARGMLSLSYYFLGTGHFDKFKEALHEAEEGSKEYKKKTGNPENPEWLREYYALATEPTVNVCEWLYPQLVKVMLTKKKYKERQDKITKKIYMDSATDKLDDAVGPETPLHTSKQYKDCFPYIKKHAKELYLDEGLDEGDAEKYAELLTKYLLDYPIKAYDTMDMIVRIKAGMTWTRENLKQLK